MWIGELQFDPDLASGYCHRASIRLEPDFQRVQALIRLIAPIGLVYSTRLGSMPAGMKVHIDRVGVPGFAFRQRADRSFTQQLLTG